MLASRVALIRDYVKAVEAGQLPLNHEVIREANALIARLPVLQSERFQPQFYKQCNDSALMTLMGSVQKSCNDLMQFITSTMFCIKDSGSLAEGCVEYFSEKHTKGIGVHL